MADYRLRRRRSSVNTYSSDPWRIKAHSHWARRRARWCTRNNDFNGLCALNTEMRHEKITFSIYLIFHLELQNEVSWPRFEQNLASQQYSLQSVNFQSILLCLYSFKRQRALMLKCILRSPMARGSIKNNFFSLTIKTFKRFPHENLKLLRKLMKQQTISSTARRIEFKEDGSTSSHVWEGTLCSFSGNW